MKKLKELLTRIKGYFNLLADKEDEQGVYTQVNNSVTFRGTNLWILIFAIFIASLGLNVNSTAVIIGAMLISPLMGPIIGMGFAVGINDFDLLKRSFKNFAVATLISVVTATVYFAISPLNEARSELLARTSPTLYDVLIAFFGGAAGVLALTTKSKGQVIPGVAIATALMPPLCTAGYGLATAQWNYFLGAFYLFFINSLFIATATFLGVKLLRFHSTTLVPPERLKRGRRIISVIVVVALIPAAFLTVRIIQDSVSERNLKNFISQEFTDKGVHIMSTELTGDTLVVVALGREMDSVEVSETAGRMKFYGMEGTGLKVIQANDSPNARVLAKELSRLNEQNNSQAAEYAKRIEKLESELSRYTSLDTLSKAVTTEAATLFDGIKAVSIGMHGENPVAIVQSRDERKADAATRKKIGDWLAVRCNNKNMQVVFL
mgnify:FL=1